jgi:hypothetical protein
MKHVTTLSGDPVVGKENNRLDRLLRIMHAVTIQTGYAGLLSEGFLMSITRFQLTSALSPAEGLAVLTDFSESRVDVWPGIDAERFTVHELGDDWAEVTEGNEAAWERVRYDWDTAKRRVDITPHDSKLFGAGGGWTFTFTPEDAGTRIDVTLVRTPSSLKGKVLAALLPVIGAAPLKKSFRGPFHAS